MNHPFDTDSETDPKVNSKHLKLLEALIDNIIERLQDKSCKPKVRDALEAIKLTKQVAKTSEAEGIFWNMIDDIRNSELSEPVSTEAQIQKTILGLEDRVKNGILPVKIITDTFNQSRSEQTRLTCRRMGGLLSAMGFTKVRASNGARAIIWDDNRLVARPRKEAHAEGSRSTGHRESETDSKTPLCISPLIRGETCGSPPDQAIHPETHQRVVSSPPDQSIHLEAHQRVVLSPPDKGFTLKVHPEGDLGGYDQNLPPAEDATDHRYTIPGPGVKS